MPVETRAARARISGTAVPRRIWGGLSLAVGSFGAGRDSEYEDKDEPDDCLDDEMEREELGDAGVVAVTTNSSLDSGIACPFDPGYKLPSAPFRALTAAEKKVIGHGRHVAHKDGETRKLETKSDPPMADSKVLSWIFGFGRFEGQKPKASREMIAVKHGTTKNNMVQYFKKAFGQEYKTKELGKMKYNLLRTNLGIRSATHTPRYTKTAKSVKDQGYGSGITKSSKRTGTNWTTSKRSVNSNAPATTLFTVVRPGIARKTVPT